MTVAEWHRIAASGEGTLQRELLDGEAVTKAPMTARHADAVVRVHRIVEAAVGEAALTQMHLPVILDDRSEPKPDVSVLERPGTSSPGTRPRVLLVVEISDSNQALVYNRGRKAAYYARCGIPDCWVVDLLSAQVLVHTSPASGGYRDIRNMRGDSAVALSSLPGVAVKVSELLEG